MVKRYSTKQDFTHEYMMSDDPDGRYVDFVAYDALAARLAEAITMLSERDFEYNRKTNALIERHAKQIEGLLARLAEAERWIAQVRKDYVGASRYVDEQIRRQDEVARATDSADEVQP